MIWEALNGLIRIGMIAEAFEVPYFILDSL